MIKVTKDNKPNVYTMRADLNNEIDRLFKENLDKYNAGLLTRNEFIQHMVSLESLGAVTRP